MNLHVPGFAFFQISKGYIQELWIRSEPNPFCAVDARNMLQLEIRKRIGS